MHDYRHMTAPEKRGPDWLRLGAGAAVAVVLAAGSAQSLVYLSTRWQEQAPARAAAAQAREAREAERAARDAAEREPPVATTPSSAQPRPVEEIGAPRTLTYRAVEWVHEPSYTVSRDQIAPGFRDRRLNIEFRCTAGTDGRLHNCTATEQPAGSGLARATLPQLDRVRLRPARVGDQDMETPVSFSLSFDFRPQAGPPSPRPREDAATPAPALAPAPEASPPPTEPMTDPDPVEPAPPP